MSDKNRKPVSVAVRRTASLQMAEAQTFFWGNDIIPALKNVKMKTRKTLACTNKYLQHRDVTKAAAPLTVAAGPSLDFSYKAMVERGVTESILQEFCREMQR